MACIMGGGLQGNRHQNQSLRTTFNKYDKYSRFSFLIEGIQVGAPVPDMMVPCVAERRATARQQQRNPLSASKDSLTSRASPQMQPVLGYTYYLLCWHCAG